MTSPHHPGIVATAQYHHGHHPSVHHQGHYEFTQHGPTHYPGGASGGFFPQSYEPHGLVSFYRLPSVKMGRDF